MSNLFLIAFSHNPVNFSKSLVTDRPLLPSLSLCLSHERERRVVDQARRREGRELLWRGKRGRGGERGRDLWLKKHYSSAPGPSIIPIIASLPHHLIPMERHSPLRTAPRRSIQNIIAKTFLILRGSCSRILHSTPSYAKRKH